MAAQLSLNHNAPGRGWWRYSVSGGGGTAALDRMHRNDGELSGHSGAFDSNLGCAYAVSGRREEAIKIIKDLEALQDRNTSTDAEIALVYVGLGDPDQAMISLNKAYEARFKASILLRPAFDPLRSDTRFQDLLSRIGLPQTVPRAGHPLF
jgi:tetratricopeptide (TPR) repeat protein